MMISQETRDTAKRLVWTVTESVTRPPVVTSIHDRHNPAPEYQPDRRVDEAARVRLSELIAARQSTVPGSGKDGDTVFRSVASRDAVLRVDEPAIVEPGLGWAVLPRGVPIYESHYAARLVQSPLGRGVSSPLANPAGWALATLRPPRQRLPVAISLLDWLAGNYVHFLDIIVNRVRLADEVGLPATIPLLVARSVAEKPFCRDFLALNPDIHERTLLIDQRVRVDQLYLIRTAMDAKESYDYTRSRIPTPPPVGTDRLLLVRRVGAAGRSVENEAEVEEVCREFGFVPYDPAADSLVEQASRFANARFVISPHGAGLSNIMFRAGGDLGVLELFPSRAIRDHFFILSRHYGFDYHAMVGESLPVDPSVRDRSRASFHIDIPSLTEKLERMTSEA